MAAIQNSNLFFYISGTALHKTQFLVLIIYISEYSNFKYFILELIQHPHPPFLKMAAVNITVPISYEIRQLKVVILASMHI